MHRLWWNNVRTIGCLGEANGQKSVLLKTAARDDIFNGVLHVSVVRIGVKGV